ncbi:phospholipase D1-like [Pecten maximus]|uniref:phospholipase D1-like n=1 Tax=Pecten maximus TaxID=6579 RepID=UPI0014585FAD|nr:phospholipase D1-like [Pecten maximus]
MIHTRFGRTYKRFFRTESSATTDSEHDSDFEDLPDFHPDGTDGHLTTSHTLEGSGQGGLDFNTIHAVPQGFTTIRKNCWIPNTRVFIKIISAERHNAHIKIFNPTLYTVQVTHGEFQWTVRRRFKHFDHLHSTLRNFRMQRRIPLPTKSHYEKRKSVRGRQNRIPRFPKKPEVIVRDIDKRRRHLEDYLQNLVDIPTYREHFETLKFLEVSQLSFVKKLGKKYKEGAIMKCSGGRHISIGCCGCLKKFHLAGRWNKRWLIVKDGFVAYIRPRDGRICDVMLMDRDFCVNVGMGTTGAHHGLLVTNLNRNLLAKCWTRRKAEEWKRNIEDAAMTTGKDYTQENRFQSFAPIREPSYAKWFVDGDSYFSAVADALESAKEEIYITDWWLSPQVYLKRPVTDGNTWRLDILLERKAQQGVKIFILLYKEMSMAVNLLSIYSKHVLMSKCPENIKVLRHPDHIGSGVLLWAHHEKLVVVDQKIAFVGGIDLCYGRWDDNHHKLTDLGCIVYESTNQNSQKEIKVKLQSQEKVEEEEDVLNQSGISLKISPPSPLSSPSEEKVPSIIPPQGGSTEEEVKTTSSNLPHGSSTEQEMQKSSINSPQGVSTDQEVKKTKDCPVKKEVDKTNVDEGNDSEECSCHKCRTSENRHSYSNSSMEEEEYTYLLKSEKKMDTNTESSDSDNQEVIKALIHHDSQGSKPLDEGSTVNGTLDPSSALEVGDLQGKSVILQGEEEQVKNGKSADRVKLMSKKSKDSEKCDQIKKVNFSEENSVQCDSVTGTTSPTKRHLWNFGGKRTSAAKTSKNLELSGSVVDKSTDSQSGDKNVQLKSFKRMPSSSKYVVDENGDSHLIQEDDEAVAKRVHTESQGEGLADSGGRDSWAMRKLRRSLQRHREQNNNDGDRIDQTDDSENLMRKWKLVLNIQKFESAVRRPQEKTPLPDGEERGPHSPARLRDKIRHNLHERFKSSHHRDSLTSLDEMYITDELKPAELKRTSSEINIDELGLKGSSKLWIGKDYVNFIYKDFQNLERPFEDFIDRSATPRMPWHDIASVVYGKAARDVARHFIGRWNFTKVEKAKNNRDYPLLLPKAYGHNYKIPQLVLDLCEEVKTQILRSACAWSCGIRTTENSIHEAYVSCIQNAKHYIYIENQFFISLIGESPTVKNRISDTLFKRIVKAHKEQTAFRVFVVMPLLPAFEGNIADSGGYAIKAITHWNYLSIAKGPNSIWQRLVKEVIDPLKYIVFCGLRTHGELSGKLVTELVYVHSKLMIVDDDTVIIGSANINDRSMSGERDSEVAVLVEDIHKTDVKFNGHVHRVGKFASTLRKKLFSEHLGLARDDPLLEDPVCDEFYKSTWIQQATINTTMFQKVFNCFPDDRIMSFAEFEEYQKQPVLAETDPVEAKKLLSKVKGYIVLVPLNFLKMENSIIPVGRESFLPNSVWV